MHIETTDTQIKIKADTTEAELISLVMIDFAMNKLNGKNRGHMMKMADAILTAARMIESNEAQGE